MRQRCLCTHGREHQQQQTRHGGALPFALAQQLAKTSVPIHQHAYQPDEEQRVARVGNGNAIGVGIHSEIAAAHIIVKAALVEPCAIARIDFVHCYLVGRGLSVALDKDVRDIVHGCHVAGMVAHAKPLERQCEGQWPLLARLRGIGRCRLSFAQMDHAFMCRQVGEQRPKQDDDKRQMEQHQQRASHPLPDEIGCPQSHADCPKQREPPCTEELVGHYFCAGVFANDGSKCHQGNEEEINEFEWFLYLHRYIFLYALRFSAALVLLSSGHCGFPQRCIFRFPANSLRHSIVWARREAAPK